MRSARDGHFQQRSRRCPGPRDPTAEMDSRFRLINCDSGHVTSFPSEAQRATMRAEGVGLLGGRHSSVPAPRDRGDGGAPALESKLGACVHM